MIDPSSPPASHTTPIRMRLLHRFCAHRTCPLFSTALAIALILPSLGIGWLGDDDHIRLRLLGLGDFMGMGDHPMDLFRFADGDTAHNAQLIDLGVWPWWPLPEIKAAFYRPLASFTHRLDFQAKPNRTDASWH